ncbi:11506_t:CDS:2 [Dentiscutata heterogama]|uniref:11506_t:CDS:1 n=1 Tax=Dentiscutata heterogama TaxID=1316150 RepID=A0ACA9KB35_9GLOM|nr:11506_t:CDS:2 [Dentiscutata heterogama]
MYNGNTSHSLLLLSPQMWSVHDFMEAVGQPHVGVYTIIEKFQKEQQKVDYQVKAIIHGAQCSAPKKETIEREKRFDTIIKNQQNFTLMEFLCGIAHNFSL